MKTMNTRIHMRFMDIKKLSFMDTQHALPPQFGAWHEQTPFQIFLIFFHTTTVSAPIFIVFKKLKLGAHNNVITL